MFVDPTQIIDSLEIEPGMVAADFGAGAGFYTVELAKKVGEGGKVYAIDIQKHMLDIIRSKARLNRLLNIETIWADLENVNSVPLKENTVDLVLISNILFQVEDKENLLKEAIRLLKPGGKVVVVEWRKNQLKFGPPPDRRISSQDVQKLFSENGLKLDKEVYAGEYHYGLVFKKA